MLVLSRLSGRCRVWHKIVRVVMVSAGLAVILIGFLSSYPSGVRVSQSLEKYRGPAEPRDPARIPWRHNRALQFMDVDRANSQDSDSIRIKTDLPQQKSKTISDRNLEFNGGRPTPYAGEIPDSIRETKGNLNRQDQRGADHVIKIDTQPMTEDYDGSLKQEASNYVRNLRYTADSKNSDVLNINKPKANNLTRHGKHGAHHERAWRNSTEKPARRLPKVLIIGVKKAGTRALLEFLRAHPSIESPGPEPHFFDRNYHRGLHWYRELMPRSQADQLTVEKTPAYFVSPEVPQRVHDLDPGMKLLLVVRDPVTRAISDYCQAASKRRIQPFEQMAVAADDSPFTPSDTGQVRANWSAIRIGLYAQHLARWLRVFPLGQIHVVDGQSLIDNPASELAQVEQFLGIPAFTKDSHFRLRTFKGKFPCLVRSDGSVHCLNNRSKGREHPVVRESVLRRLRQFYKPHNERFFNMIGRTFEWKSS
ncbi:hypothetical protein EGW08_009876 [Elysia chlorotica]|uniref:Sulfotransferase domain-containing protein n=1 Tax=Elysia chlorotica TaxID=188477 RepID=A0A3S1HMC3_ELYCH|nr:hypothetical protein EGW08_009876 [Elysia chlorotica]